VSSPNVVSVVSVSCFAQSGRSQAVPQDPAVYHAQPAGAPAGVLQDAVHIPHLQAGIAGGQGLVSPVIGALTGGRSGVMSAVLDSPD